MKWDYALIALRNLRNRSKRTWLTMIGIFIGIAAVVALISLGQGLEDAIFEEFSAVGGDKVLVRGKSAGFGPPGFQESGKVTEDDIKIIKRVNGVLEASGQVFQAANIEFNDEATTQFIVSLPDDDAFDMVAEFNTYEVTSGRMLKKNDRGKVLIGENFISQEIFRKRPRLGNKIQVNDHTYEIVGILKKTGDPGADKAVVAMIDDVREIVDEPESEDLNYLVARISPNVDPEAVVEPMRRALRRDRGQKEGKEDFEVETAANLVASFQNIFSMVQLVLVGIACISLIVGGIGIMNTMYTSVLERTKEIGIMKAIGARNSDVLSIFLIESGLLGMAGGVIGVLIGMGLSMGVEYVGKAVVGTELLRASFPWYLIVGALLFSFLIGTLSGVFPARQASHLKPVDALRYE